MSVFLPDLTALPELVTEMTEEEIQVLLALGVVSVHLPEARTAVRKLTCGKAVLNVWYSSSTVGFLGASVILELNVSRYLRMCAISSLRLSSQPASKWPTMILTGFSASMKSSVKYQACRMAGVSISSTLVTKNTDFQFNKRFSSLTRTWAHGRQGSLPGVCAPTVHGVSSDDCAFRRQPEQSVVDRVALDGAQQAYGTRFVPLEQEE